MFTALGKSKSIYKFGLSVCLYPINVKTAEPIGPKFVWDLKGPQGRFRNDQYFKNVCLNDFIIVKF